MGGDAGRLGFTPSKRWWQKSHVEVGGGHVLMSPGTFVHIEGGHEKFYPVLTGGYFQHGDEVILKAIHFRTDS